MAYTNAVIWSNSTGVAIYIRQIGNVQSGPIAGVKSCTITRIDDYYDTDVYRDTSDLSTPFTPLANGAYGTSGNTDANFLGMPTASTLLLASSISTAGAVTLSSTTTNPGTLTTGALVTVDDRASHIPPRDVRKSRSLVQFWNDVSGGGAAVAAAWADEYMGMSIAEFDTIQ